MLVPPPVFLDLCRPQDFSKIQEILVNSQFSNFTGVNSPRSEPSGQWGKVHCNESFTLSRMTYVVNIIRPSKNVHCCIERFTIYSILYMKSPLCYEVALEMLILQTKMPALVFFNF